MPVPKRQIGLGRNKFKQSVAVLGHDKPLNFYNHSRRTGRRKRVLLLLLSRAICAGSGRHLSEHMFLLTRVVVPCWHIPKIEVVGVRGARTHAQLSLFYSTHTRATVRNLSNNCPLLSLCSVLGLLRHLLLRARPQLLLEISLALLLLLSSLLGVMCAILAHTHTHTHDHTQYPIAGTFLFLGFSLCQTLFSI